MGKYEQIIKAMEAFGLNEEETIVNVKRKINNHLRKWHPDKCASKEEKDIYHKKSISLIEAKKIIMDYCDNYKISFKQDEVGKYENPEEFWNSHFGRDQHWGNKN